MDGGALDRWRLGRRAQRVDWEAVSTTRPGVRVLELAATRIRVRVQGDRGPAFLFLCDPPNLVEHYDRLFACFDGDVTVGCLEQPGFGFSFPGPGYDFGVRAHAQALASTLETLGFPECALVAPCVSAYSAMRVARERPDLVSRLVLMQATDLATERRWVLRTAEKFTRRVTGIPRLGGLMAQVPFLAQAVAAATERTFGERTYDSVIFPEAEDREGLLEGLVKESNRAFARGACNCMPNLVQTYLSGPESDFAGARQPTLVLWGDSDQSHRDSPRDGLCRYLADARVERIPDTAHHLELERPETVTAAIRAFASR